MLLFYEKTKFDADPDGNLDCRTSINDTRERNRVNHINIDHALTSSRDIYLIGRDRLMTKKYTKSAELRKFNNAVNG